MARPTKTTSGRWEIKGDPNDPRAKWEHQPGDKWRSKRTGDVDIKKIGPWIDDMEEWSEMVYDAVLELREQVAQIAVIRHELHELSEVVASVKRDLRPAPK